MRHKSQYILFVLILIVVYLMYLIVLYKYRDFQINSYINQLTTENQKLQDSINDKRDYLAYINTNAFLDKTAKTSQNKKNPGEDVVFLVSKEDIEAYKNIDIGKQMIETDTRVSPTQNMSNPEKWMYYIFKIDIRDE